MNIKLADFSHKKELTELWIEAFADNKNFIASFLDAYMIPEYNTPVIIADGKIVSAFYLVEFELYSNMNCVGKCAYLFAAATKKEYRGRGYMPELIKYAAELYKNRGIKAIFLFPQEDWLFNFYEKLGFSAIYQAKKISSINKGSNIRKTLGDLTGFTLENQTITNPDNPDNTDIFDGLYKAYADFTAKQALSPLKDRWFYYKCAASYLESAENKFAIFERKIHKNESSENNVEKFCYVFYKKDKNTYYIDDIIFPAASEYSEYYKYSELLTDYFISLGSKNSENIGTGVKVETNTLPVSFSDTKNVKMAMIMPLSDDIKEIVSNLKSPIYLNMFMNI